MSIQASTPSIKVEHLFYFWSVLYNSILLTLFFNMHFGIIKVSLSFMKSSLLHHNLSFASSELQTAIFYGCGYKMEQGVSCFVKIFSKLYRPAQGISRIKTWQFFNACKMARVKLILRTISVIFPAFFFLLSL